MSAVSLMSVLTPAAPGGASADASVEAATDCAVFADLMLKEEAQAAPPVVSVVPVAQASETTAPIEAAPVEPAKDDIAVAPAPPAWFAPPPPVQQTAAPTAPADPTAPTTEATPAVAAAPSPAPLAVSEAVEAAPVAPTAEPAAATTATTATAAPVSAVMTPPATISAALKAALPAVFAEPDAAPEPPSTESDEPSDAPPPSRPGAALPAQDAALLGVTGFRSGAGERLASAREAIQAAATATGNAEATANRPAQADAPIDAAASAPAARPAVAPALAETPAAAAVAAPPVDGEAPAAPQQGAVEAPSQAPGAQRDLGLSQLSRATVETTAQIAAQIVKKLDGRSTRFDMALTPEGLGRVDVSLEIESDGQVTARLAFDNPAAAADLRARADELRRQLLDAGLQLSRDDLEFAERDPSSGFGGGAFERQPDRRAFSGAARLAAEADSVVPPPSAWTSLSLTPDRVDLKV